MAPSCRKKFISERDVFPCVKASMFWYTWCDDYKDLHYELTSDEWLECGEKIDISVNCYELGDLGIKEEQGSGTWTLLHFLISLEVMHSGAFSNSLQWYSHTTGAYFNFMYGTPRNLKSGNTTPGEGWLPLLFLLEMEDEALHFLKGS